jgi:hypothetical protein
LQQRINLLLQLRVTQVNVFRYRRLVICSCMGHEPWPLLQLVLAVLLLLLQVVVALRQLGLGYCSSC